MKRDLIYFDKKSKPRAKGNGYVLGFIVIGPYSKKKNRKDIYMHM